MMSALSLESAGFKKLCIPFVNDLLDGDLLFDFCIFSFFLNLNHNFIIYITITHWHYPYCSFKHRKWWRHKLRHT